MDVGYIFDQSWELERERLTALQDWLDPGTIRHLEDIGVAEGWRCLEVAGGAGSIARWLAERVGPTGHVLSTDLDTRFLEMVETPNLEVRRHDIVNDDLPEASFDLAHARLLLEHLPQRTEALKQMVAAVKPGGIVFVEDHDFLTNMSLVRKTGYRRVIDAALKLMSAAGYDRYLGRRLPAMLREAGLTNVRSEGRVYIGRPGEDPFGKPGENPGMRNFRITLGFFRAPLVAAGDVTDRDIDRMLEILADPEFEGISPMTVAAWGRRPTGR